MSRTPQSYASAIGQSRQADFPPLPAAALGAGVANGSCGPPPIPFNPLIRSSASSKKAVPPLHAKAPVKPVDRLTEAIGSLSFGATSSSVSSIVSAAVAISASAAAADDSEEDSLPQRRSLKPKGSAKSETPPIVESPASANKLPIPTLQSLFGTCYALNRPKGCKYGDDCDYKHVIQPPCDEYSVSGWCSRGGICPFAHKHVDYRYDQEDEQQQWSRQVFTRPFVAPNAGYVNVQFHSRSTHTATMASSNGVSGAQVVVLREYPQVDQPLRRNIHQVVPPVPVSSPPTPIAVVAKPTALPVASTPKPDAKRASKILSGFALPAAAAAIATTAGASVSSPISMTETVAAAPGIKVGPMILAHSAASPFVATSAKPIASAMPSMPSPVAFSKTSSGSGSRPVTPSLSGLSPGPSPKANVAPRFEPTSPMALVRMQSASSPTVGRDSTPSPVPASDGLVGRSSLSRPSPINTAAASEVSKSAVVGVSALRTPTSVAMNSPPAVRPSGMGAVRQQRPVQPHSSNGYWKATPSPSPGWVRGQAAPVTEEQDIVKWMLYQLRGNGLSSMKLADGKLVIEATKPPGGPQPAYPAQQQQPYHHHHPSMHAPSMESMPLTPGMHSSFGLPVQYPYGAGHIDQTYMGPPVPPPSAHHYGGSSAHAGYYPQMHGHEMYPAGAVPYMGPGMMYDGNGGYYGYPIPPQHPHQHQQQFYPQQQQQVQEPYADEGQEEFYGTEQGVDEQTEEQAEEDRLAPAPVPVSANSVAAVTMENSVSMVVRASDSASVPVGPVPTAASDRS